MAGEGQCDPGPDNPCRVNLDLMDEFGRMETWTLMVLLTGVALAIAAYGVWQMVHVWKLGRDWQPGDWKKGLKRFTAAMASHRKFKQREKAGTMHGWIFFSFVVLFIGTVLAAIDMDVFELMFGAKLLQGNGYLVYEAVLDAFGVVFILGVGLALVIRGIDRPPHLHPTKHVEAPTKKPLRGDMYLLWILLGIGITGFLLEGMRLRHQMDVEGITYAGWSFVGALLARAFTGMDAAVLVPVYQATWWLHFALWSGVLAILPWTKLKHIVSSSLNVYFHDPDRQARPALSKPFDLQEMMESGDMDLPDVGYTTIRDLTWKDRLALDACTNCGRCEAQCPATAAGRPLSPRKLIQDLKEHMWQDYRDEKRHVKAGGAPAARPGEEAGENAYRPQELTAVADMKTQIEEATLWSCTTCRACMTECPVDIEHVDIITEMRRSLVNASRLDEHQSKLLVNMTNTGNPYGFAMTDRANWTAGLPEGVSVPTAAEKVARGEPIELLWWVGCVGSFDPRNNEVTRSIATVLHHAGVDVCILGNDEKCNGDPARRLGEEGRFQQSVIENLMVLNELGVKKVLTQCPHCFNTLRNEYPEFGADWEVVHHTTFIEELLAQERIPLKQGKQMQIAYHDSCYLGRHNGIYDAPRNVLEQTNGLPVLEMAQSGYKGLCCGAGGSNMWFEIGEEKERINVIRAKQAADTGAETVVSNCPFCLTMINDGIGLTGNEGKMVAKDLAEVVAEHIDPDWQKDWAQAPDEPAAEAAGTSGEAAEQAAEEAADQGVQAGLVQGAAGEIGGTARQPAAPDLESPGEQAVQHGGVGEEKARDEAADAAEEE